MKMRQKLFSIVLVIILAAGGVLAVRMLSYREPYVCCVCSSFRYHAPCLIDLKTGSIMELDVYFSHPTKVAELADPQPEQSTISFVQLGNASGCRDTGNRRVEVSIPRGDKTYTPALCRQCKEKLGSFHFGRYVLADLYAPLHDNENKQLLPITNGLDITLRCYTITACRERGNTLKLVIQGNLP